MFGLNPPVEIGLNLDGLATGTPAPGNHSASLVPAPMTFNVNYQWFEAEGIPMTPFPDNPTIDTAGNPVKNFYPTVKVVARDLSNNILAKTTTVLPVSDEMTCKGCHASTSATTNLAQIAAKPTATTACPPTSEPAGIGMIPVWATSVDSKFSYTENPNTNGNPMARQVFIATSERGILR